MLLTTFNIYKFYTHNGDDIPQDYILLVLRVLCECETCFLSLKEEHWLRMFDSGVLWMILGTEIEEVMGEWGKLHNEDPHDLYFSLNVIWVMIQSRKIRWVGHVAHMGERRGA